MIDIALVSATVAVDQFVHGDERPQSLASAWPLVAVLATGVAVGPGWGLPGGAVVGLAGLGAAALDGDLSGRLLGLSGVHGVVRSRRVDRGMGGTAAADDRAGGSSGRGPLRRGPHPARRGAADTGGGAAALGRPGAGGIGA